MRIFRCVFFGFVLVVFLTAPEEGRAQGRRRPAADAPASQSVGDSGRDTALYNADRPVDFLHMRLEVAFSPDGLRQRTCEGRVEYALRPRAAVHLMVGRVKQCVCPVRTRAFSEVCGPTLTFRFFSPILLLEALVSPQGLGTAFIFALTSSHPPYIGFNASPQCR